MNKNKIYLSTSIVLVVILIAYTFVYVKKMNVERLDGVSPTVPSGYKMYTNDKYGFQIEYENGMKPVFTEYDSTSSLKSSGDIRDRIEFKNVSGGFWNEAVYISTTSALSVEDVLKSRTAISPNHNQYRIDRTTKVAGYDASVVKRVPTNPDDLVAENNVIFIKDGRLYEILLWKIDQERILNSFKFIR